MSFHSTLENDERDDVERKHIASTLKDLRLSEQNREILYTNGWSESSADLLESWVKYCDTQSVLHIKSAKSHRNMHQRLTLPTLVTGTIASALGFYNSGGECGSSNFTLSILVSVLTSTSTILTGFSVFKSHNTKMEKHLASAGLYASLANEIKQQLYLPLAKKSDIEVVTTCFGQKLTDLIINSPLV